MEQEARDRFLKFFKDEKKYDLGTLDLFLDKLETTHIEFYTNKGREVYSIGITDNSNNREVLSKYLTDLDEFFKELENSIYVHADDEYQLMDLIDGANDIDYDGTHLKLGYRYHKSTGEDMFYLYNESELNELPWL